MKQKSNQELQHKAIFDPEKISVLDFRIKTEKFGIPEHFNMDNVDGHQVEYKLELGTRIEEKLIKADLIIDIITESKQKNINEAEGHFQFNFIYKIENLDELIHSDKNGIDIHPVLGNSLASITYSTARGILLTRLQSTVFQDFILPIINPSQLLKKYNSDVTT